MIVESYPSKRPKVVAPPTVYPQQQQGSYGHQGPWLSPKELMRATKLKITNAEYHRRHMIVKEHARNCKWKQGDVVVPVSDEGQKKYGKCQITGIVDDYYNYGDDWPISNHPLIVHFTTENGGSAFATVNYFKDLNAC